MSTPQKTIHALPDPTAESPQQWSIVAKEDIPELWGSYRRGGKLRHQHLFVYPCLDKQHALDLLRSLLESRKLFGLRHAQQQYGLGRSHTTVRETLKRPAPRTQSEMAEFARSWDAKVEQGRTQ